MHKRFERCFMGDEPYVFALPADDDEELVGKDRREVGGARPMAKDVGKSKRALRSAHVAEAITAYLPDDYPEDASAWTALEAARENLASVGTPTGVRAEGIPTPLELEMLYIIWQNDMSHWEATRPKKKKMRREEEEDEEREEAPYDKQLAWSHEQHAELGRANPFRGWQAWSKHERMLALVLRDARLRAGCVDKKPAQPLDKQLLTKARLALTARLMENPKLDLALFQELAELL